MAKRLDHGKRNRKKSKMTAGAMDAMREWDGVTVNVGVIMVGNPKGGDHYRERDACGRGHTYVDGSWYWRADGGGRACKICRKENKAKLLEKAGDDVRAKLKDRANEAARERRAAKKLGIPVEEYRTMQENMVKKNPLAYLKLTPAQAAASDKLNFQVDRVGRPQCEETVAKHMDYDERTPPTAVEAAKMCAGCPLMEECANLAAALKPKTGVWAGTVWIDGVPQN